MEDFNIEFCNLSEKDTGVRHTVYISSSWPDEKTAIRVFVDFPDIKKFIRILIPEELNSDAEIINSENIDFFEESDLHDAKNFVMLNRMTLLDFWYNGVSWCITDVTDMAKNLRKVIT